MITIKKGVDPGLEPPGFVCDKVLKQDVPPPFDLLVDGYKFCVFIGRPGSGKTSFLYSLFKDRRCLKKTWSNVTICCHRKASTQSKRKTTLLRT